MTDPPNVPQLVWTARQVGTLLTKLSAVLQDWASSVESSAPPAPAAASSTPHSVSAPTPSSTPGPAPPSSPRARRPPRPSSPPSPRSLDAPSTSALTPPSRPTSDPCPSAPSSTAAATIAAAASLTPAPAAAAAAAAAAVDALRAVGREALRQDVLRGAPKKRRELSPPATATATATASGAGSEDGRAPKRVRVDWSKEENVTLFATLEKFPFMSETELVDEIVKALAGSRTHFQTRGRFRNLLANGRIRVSDSNPRKWVVVPARGGRRVRVNWSEEEEEVLMETVGKFKHLDEDSLLQEIVKELGGSRTWFQVKGHFRNILTSGKIRGSGTIPHYWIVTEDDRSKGEVTSNGETDKAGEDAETGSEAV